MKQKHKMTLTETKLRELPICNLCNLKKAKYDGKTKIGAWAYMCNTCFKLYGIGLGTGRGQKLIPV